jgi:hypothetical protein
MAKVEHQPSNPIKNINQNEKNPLRKSLLVQKSFNIATTWKQITTDHQINSTTAK